MDLEQNELNKFTIWFSDIRRYAIDNMVIDFRDCLQPNLNYQFRMYSVSASELLIY